MDFPGGVDGAQGNGGKAWYQECGNVIKIYLYGHRDHVKLNVFGFLWDFPGGSDSKASVYNVRDLGSIPGLERVPGEGNGNPLQYSCLENHINGGAWCRLLSMGLQRVGHD